MFMKVIQFMLRAFSAVMLYFGFVFKRATPYRELVSFLNQLKPCRTNFDLIRVGGDGDGGYLIPNDIDGISACFSPGVSDKSYFELDLAHKGIKSYMVDYSVNAPSLNNKLFTFDKKYLGVENNDRFITLESWMEQYEPVGEDFILQMDIEGSEYPVIFNTSEETFKRFRILVIEFHGLDSMVVNQGFDSLRLTFSKILRNFEVVHIHPNNCCGSVKYFNLEIPRVMEFTFIRKDRVVNKVGATNFPHPLDKKCVNELPDIVLPRCWYGLK